MVSESMNTWFYATTPVPDLTWYRLSPLTFMHLDNGLLLRFERRQGDGEPESKQYIASLSSPRAGSFAAPLKLDGEDAYTLYRLMVDLTKRDDPDQESGKPAKKPGEKPTAPAKSTPPASAPARQAQQGFFKKHRT